MDIVDRDKVGWMESDLAAVGGEMNPIVGWWGVVAGFQTGVDVEIDGGREMTGVLASTPRGGLLIAAQGKEG